MTQSTLRHCSVALFIGVLGLCTASATLAQTPTPRPTGEFLCSAGSRDGVACNSDDDCPGGVCVIAQGVCDGGTDDGFPCDCAAGKCNAQPVCSTDAALGTCAGGTSAGGCCDVTTNCTGGVTCRGTQKVCLAGANKGFSCLNDAQCPLSTCRSTGKFCNGGDFDGFSCVDNNDCPGTSPTPPGICVTAIPTTPTQTVGTTTATRTRTPTATSRTSIPTTVTPTRTPTIQTTVIPTATATRTPTVPTVHPTNTRPPTGTREIFIAQGGGCSLIRTNGGHALILLIGAGLTMHWLRKRWPRSRN